MPVRSNNQFLERNSDPNSVDDSGINANNFGGLNTVASPLSLPFEDSPALQNITIDLSGNVKKRKGTRATSVLSGTSSGVSVTPITTGLGYNFAVVKNGVNIAVYETVGNITYQCLEKLNVWPSSASNVRASICQTNETDPRVILCTGICPPVQLQFVEYRETITPGAPSTSFAFNDAEKFQYAAADDIIVFQGDTRVASGYSVGYSSGTYTISSLPSYSTPTTFTVIHVSWQWMAEAYRYFGLQFWQNRTRYNVDKTDVSVAIPSELRDNVDLVAGTEGEYAMRVYSNNKFTSNTYSFDSNLNPTSATEYSFSNGAYYDAAASDDVTPSPDFITFGALQSGSPAPVSSAFVARSRRVNFNAGRGAQAQHVRVFRNGTLATQSTTSGTASGTYGRYNTRDSTFTYQTSSTTGNVSFVSFDASTTRGVGAIDVVEIHNVQLRNTGSAATTNRNQYRDGSYTPVFGLGNFSDYYRGSHPRSACIYQGRLVFAGFPANPMLVVASNTYDSATPGINFNNFQILEEYDPTTETIAVDVLLSNVADDYIIAPIEFQGSLFVFTRRGVFRLYPNEGIFKQANIITSFIANFGAVNSNCVNKVDSTVLFLSDSGVYDLTSTAEAGDYRAGERSLKIRNQFPVRFNATQEKLCWMGYNTTSRELFLGFPGSSSHTTEKLYVYSTVREAWTEWTTPGKFKAFLGYEYIDRTLGPSFHILCTTYLSSGVPNNLVFNKTDEPRYIDYASYYTGNGVLTDYAATPQVFSSQTTTAGTHQYPIGFDTFPLTNVEDIQVTVDGVISTFDVDYFKRAGGFIYYNEDLGAGKTLKIELKRPVNDYPVGVEEYDNNTSSIDHVVVFVDNIEQLQTQGFSVVEVSNVTYARLTAANNSIVCVGQAYWAQYTTPLFTRQSLSRFKRVLHWHGYFDNEPETNLYFSSDRNTSSSQSAETIEGHYKVKKDANIAFVYNSDSEGEISADVYGFTDVIWDDAYFDVNPANNQVQKYVLIKEPIQGVGYGFQVLVWSFDSSTFVLCGYQIDAKVKGPKYTGFS